MAQIHQEIEFDVTPDAVYKALTSAPAFAAWSGAPAQIGTAEGDAFLCFGEFIAGRHIELIPGVRVVQAWRVFNWTEGVYSVVRFELTSHGAGTLLIFEQSGVPHETLAHVEGGWHNKYWEPMKKFLAADRC